MIHWWSFFASAYAVMFVCDAAEPCETMGAFAGRCVQAAISFAFLVWGLVDLAKVGP